MHILFLDVRFFLNLHGIESGVAKFPVVYLIPLTMLREDICQLFGGDMCFVQINVVHWETGGMGWLRELNVDCLAGLRITVLLG